MSPERSALRQMARTERGHALVHVKHTPARVVDAAKAFAARHPLCAMGAAAALAVLLTSRVKRSGLKKLALQGKSKRKLPSWPIALAGARLIPDAWRLANFFRSPARDEIQPQARRPAASSAASGRHSQQAM